MEESVEKQNQNNLLQFFTLLPVSPKELKISAERLDNINRSQNLENVFSCPICLHLVINPVMCKYCGRLFCKECLDEWRSKNKHCPLCKAIYRNQEVNRNLMTILKGLIINCKFCGTEVINEVLCQHYNTLCSKCPREAKCNSCSEVIQTTNLMLEAEEHKNICPEMVINCTLSVKGCVETFPRKLEEDHHKKLCKFTEFECKICGVKMERSDWESKHSLDLCFIKVKEEYEKRIHEMNMTIEELINSNNNKKQSEEKSMEISLQTELFIPRSKVKSKNHSLLFSESEESQISKPNQNEPKSESKILCLVYVEESGIIAAGESNSSISIWDEETLVLKVILYAHDSPVLCLTEFLFHSPLNSGKYHTSSGKFIKGSSSGSFLVSGSADCTIRFWDLKKSLNTLTLTGHQGHILSLLQIQYSKYSDVIASGSADATLRLWNANTGRVIFVLNNNNTTIQTMLQMNGGGDLVVIGKVLIYAGTSKDICMWDPEDKRKLKALRGHNQSILCLTQVIWSRDSLTILSSSSDLFIKVWNISSRTVLLSIPCPSPVYSLTQVKLESDFVSIITLSKEALRIVEFYESLKIKDSRSLIQNKGLLISLAELYYDENDDPVLIISSHEENSKTSSLLKCPLK